MESTRSSTRNRRLTSAMVLLSLARTMSLYLWTMSSGRATSWSRYCLKDRDKIHSQPFWLTTYGQLSQHGKHLSDVCGSHFWFDSLERVPFIRLLDGLQDAFVYPEADGDRQQGQADVRDDAHDAARHQGQEQQEGGAKHHACCLHISPVHKIHHCKRRKRRGLCQSPR